MTNIREKLNLSKEEFYSIAALVAVALIWSSGFIATDTLLRSNWNTSLILAGRFSIATVVIFISLNKQVFNSSKRERVTGSIAGAILFVAFYLQTIGQSQSTVSNTAFFTASNVVMVPFISWVVNKIRPSRKTILLSLLTLMGIAVISYIGGSFSLNLGDVIILLGAFLFASHIVWLEKSDPEFDARVVNFFQTGTAAVLAIIVLIFDRSFNAESFANIDYRAGIMAVLYLGVLSTALAYLLQTTAQQHVSASLSGVILSLEGLFGSIMSVILGLEPLTANMVVGGAMIVTATVLMSARVGDVDRRNLEEGSFALTTAEIEEKIVEENTD